MGPLLTEISGVTEKKKTAKSLLLIGQVNYLFVLDRASTSTHFNTDHVLVMLGPEKEIFQRLLT